MWWKARLDLPYVFMIGFNKSGTTSLYHFFKSQGIPAIKHDKGRLPLTMLKNAIGSKKLLRGYDTRYNVFLDLGFFLPGLHFEANQLFRVLDRDYPNSLFIYNARPMEAWLESRMNHTAWDGTLFETACQFYNTKDAGEIKSIWRLQRERFEHDVRAYFKNTDRLLELNIEDRKAPEQVAAFTGFALDAAKWEHRRKTVK
ncbi:MAG: hypothetical protein NWR47_01060 [Aestuariivirgaceae bacterium]|nr:hypothetical protein [Aestuariivirgaceae bacterium]